MRLPCASSCALHVDASLVVAAGHLEQVTAHADDFHYTKQKLAAATHALHWCHCGCSYCCYRMLLLTCGVIAFIKYIRAAESVVAVCQYVEML
jgi:hypothetical protein